MRYLTFTERLQIPTYDNPAHINFGRVVIDTAKCIKCGCCIRLCPADALESSADGPVLKAPHRSECMACGDCSAFCPENAIQLVREFRCSKGRYRTLSPKKLSLPRLHRMAL